MYKRDRIRRNQFVIGQWNLQEQFTFSCGRELVSVVSELDRDVMPVFGLIHKGGRVFNKIN